MNDSRTNTGSNNGTMLPPMDMAPDEAHILLADVILVPYGKPEEITHAGSGERGSGAGTSTSNGTNACEGQDQEFQRIFQVGYSLGMILSFPLGLCLDRVGEVPTRLLTGGVYTTSWVVLACYTLNDYCLYAWTLLAVSGFVFLTSNYSAMNYYAPGFTGTSITLLCGVFDASASVGKILGIVHDR